MNKIEKLNKIEKSMWKFLLGGYPKTNQIMQGALVSGIDRLTGSPVPGPMTYTYGAMKAAIGYHGHKMGAMEMPAWKKMSLYTIGAALPYADKIYCALAPTIETLIK